MGIDDFAMRNRIKLVDSMCDAVLDNLNELLNDEEFTMRWGDEWDRFDSVRNQMQRNKRRRIADGKEK